VNHVCYLQRVQGVHHSDGAMTMPVRRWSELRTVPWDIAVIPIQVLMLLFGDRLREAGAYCAKRGIQSTRRDEPAANAHATGAKIWNIRGALNGEI